MSRPTRWSCRGSFGGWLLLPAWAAIAAVWCLAAASSGGEGVTALTGAGDAELTNAIVIHAGRLRFNYAERSGVFAGGVTAEDTDTVLSAARMTVDFQQDNRVSQITAEGDVSVKRGGIAATCSTAVYEIASGRITMSGGTTTVARGDEVLTAERIVVLRQQQTAICERGRIRAREQGGAGDIVRRDR